MLTFNLELFSLYIIYISTLLIGFKIKKDKKHKHNENYFQFKPYLYAIIGAIHILNVVLLLEVLRFNETLFSYLIIAQLLFSAYFFIFSINQTRCWKQHRMVVFNFLLIFEIYYASQLAISIIPYLMLILINSYNILEFQFAKFNFKKAIFWD